MSRPVIIAAGGTGGHVVPALAVAEELARREVPVLWLGTRNGLEARMVPAAGFDIRWIDVAALRGQNLLRTFMAPLRLLRSCWQSARVLREVDARAVLGMGGFVSGPAGVAALLSRRPLVLHEQNAIAGMTNRYLARFATRVFAAWPAVFPDSVAAEVVGNPVRESMARRVIGSDAATGAAEARSVDGAGSDAATAADTPSVDGAVPATGNVTSASRDVNRSDRLKILVVGGSLGAKVLNDTMPEVFARLDGVAECWHQCGAGNGETVRARYAATVPDAEVRVDDFIDDMAAAYAWADLVVCRAGAMTVTELAALGKASILVPYPHAVDDHQYANARHLADAGAAIVVRQAELQADTLAGTITELAGDREKLGAMQLAAATRFSPDAARRVAEALLEVAH
ncbi:MAG: undecaprenyldiphospho-muramoylpentapeptide beta-N-acetylglucosaminyltransferase [Gammaproteobacteria bacterium]|nr:MAG: undecaprenyldiphospho-muramoylpentapeptide beta-N-acetylglucosaminyltransferase [Gammaproteobacteria bacterium]PIE35635.1 MAG: undecaprenyldiphospho-muramoylpentapeptide beta-N-acetylglucosaminyltransferase [Gammaproteobacteria bacterium]